jgi:hypothetical protein
MTYLLSFVLFVPIFCMVLVFLLEFALELFDSHPRRDYHGDI